MIKLWIATLVVAGSLPQFTHKWAAILQPSGTSVLAGTAVVEEVSDDSLTAEIQLSGAKAGSEIAWHIHLGNCGDKGKVLGAAEAYPLLKVGADGKASGSVTVPGALPSQGEYSIMVHKTDSDLTAVACGSLKSILNAVPGKPASPA